MEQLQVGRKSGIKKKSMYKPNINSFKEKNRDPFIANNPDYTWCPKHPNKYFNKKKYTKCYACFQEEQLSKERE